MNFNTFLDFIRARPILVVSLVMVALAIGFARSCQSINEVPKVQLLKTFETATSNLHFTVTRPVPEILPLTPKPAPPLPATNRLPTVVILSTNLSSDLLSIHIPPDPNAPPTGPYAPTGRLIECVLYNSVDSIAPGAPFIGLVVSGCYHDGHLIVPAETEVHGRAQFERAHDRIVSQGPWTLVWQDGRELVVTARALDRHTDDNGQGWAIDDGRVGIQAYISHGQSLNEVKFFLTEALAGVSAAMQQQTTTILGIQQLPATARNIGLSATSQVLNNYAQQLLDTIKRDGLVAFVPAGKRFYLYVEEPIDPGKAQIAGSRIRAQNTPELGQHPTATVADLGADGVRGPRPTTLPAGTLPPLSRQTTTHTEASP